MPELAIIASRGPLATGTPESLVDACRCHGLSTTLILHEDLLPLSPNWWSGARLVYFLVEEEWIQANATLLACAPARVLNLRYLAKQLLKPQTLAQLRRAELPVLHHFDPTDRQLVESELDGGGRLLAKSSFHGGWKELVETSQDFSRLRERVSNESWYLERYVLSQREFKSYAIDGTIGFGRVLEPDTELRLRAVTAEARRCLDLDLLSLDVVEDLTDRRHFIVDANAAPGFAGLNDAPNIFASFIGSILPQARRGASSPC